MRAQLLLTEAEAVAGLCGVGGGAGVAGVAVLHLTPVRQGVHGLGCNAKRNNKMSYMTRAAGDAGRFLKEARSSTTPVHARKGLQGIGNNQSTSF